MIWLLTEILVFVLAAALFGGLIGLGLATAGARSRSVTVDQERQGLLERLVSFERTQRAVEARAAARAAAEAAARGELEGRLVQAEAAAAEYRARAEAAERNLRAADTPAGATGPLIEAVVVPASDSAELADAQAALAAAEAARAEADAQRAGTEAALRRAESERDAARAAAAAAEEAAAAERQRHARETESLQAQLAAAERQRARSEAELAAAHARAQEVLRMTAALMGQPGAPTAAGAAAPQLPPAFAATPAAGAGGERPPGLPAPRGGRADDLRRIKGVGIKNEGVLNALGIFHYDQIAAFTPANVEWLDAYLKSMGRIAREDWVGQARALLAERGAPATKVHPDDAGL